MKEFKAKAQNGAVLFSSGLMAVVASTASSAAVAHASTAVSSVTSSDGAKAKNAAMTQSNGNDDANAKNAGKKQGKAQAKSEKANKASKTSKADKDAEKSESSEEAAEKTKTVTVKKGDTTWSIAQKNDTTVAKIVKDNDLKENGATILVGQKLEVHPGDKSVKDSTLFESQKDSSKQSSTGTAQSAAQASQGTAQSTSQAAVSQAPAVQNVQSQQAQSAASGTTSAPASQSAGYTSSAAGSEKAAKEWIAQRESGGSYTAQNGQYYGRYQLSSSYLGGDYSPANQEKVADNYVANRYGSWSNAQAFWQSHGWY